MYLMKLKILHFQPVIRYGDTDSIFSSYRFRELNKSMSKDKQMKIWKDIINFSEKLISHFIPIEYKYLWEEAHSNTYSLNKYY